MPGTIYDSEQRSALVEFMTDAMARMENAFKEPLAISIGNYRREKAKYRLGFHCCLK
jgi:hypothetical protein